MSEFLNSRICHIYLVYGLGFFTLGLAVALETGRITPSRFSRSMRYLAAFGLIHGFHEWIEMFEITGIRFFGFVPPPWWGVGRLAMLALSFAALVAFGVYMVYASPTHPSTGIWGTMGMLTLYAAGALALGVHWQGDEWLQAADAWTRYALGVPGALLAAGGLQRQWQELKEAGLAPYAQNFLWAAIVFALYGLVGQGITAPSAIFPSTILNSAAFSQTFGFPIQLLRSVFAGLMALFVIRGLRAFEVDRQRRLAAAQQQAQEAIARRDALRGELFSRTVTTQEEERARLARELHDDTLQMLTGLSAGLKGTEQLLTSDPQRARQQLAHLSAASSQAIEDLRRLILDLRPSMLDDMGLVPAVRWYAQSLDGRLTATVTITAEGLDCRLPAPVETILFRIAQEALNNVARHADASQVAIRLSCDGTTTRLAIQDNGVGFDTQSALQVNPSRPGWGLMGIHERVTLAGGTFQIESAPGKGTTLRVAIPHSWADPTPNQGSTNGREDTTGTD